MSRIEMTFNGPALALLTRANGVVHIVKHGGHRLFRVASAGEETAQLLAKAPLSRKNKVLSRFRLDETVAKQLELAKGKYGVEPFDMGKWTVRARWARQYPRGGWVEIVERVGESKAALAVL